MSRRKVSALALIAAGALVFTPVTIPTTHAATVNEDATHHHNFALRDDAQSGDDPQSGNPQDATTASDVDEHANDDTPTTIIVQLEGGDVGIPWDQRVFGLSTDTKHKEMQARIEASVTQSVPGATVTVQREYSHALDGFALQAPASSLQAIRNTEGVKTAFVEQTYDPAPINEERDDAEAMTAALRAADPTLRNSSSLEMIRANETAYKGDRQVIEIIDSGVATSNPAFAGSMDEVDVRLSERDVDELKKKLSHGRDGEYINKKFPFAFNYVTNTTMVDPIIDYHGSHVAAIAAANAPDLQGVAPNAQIIVARVGSGLHSGDIVDSAILSALDDAMILKPDVINLSLVNRGGMSSEAGSVYDHVLKALVEQGISINACAGNEGSVAHGSYMGLPTPYASEPDTGTVTEPGSFKPSLTVASVDNVVALPYLTVDQRNIFYLASRDQYDRTRADLRAIPEGTYRVIYAGWGSEEDLDHLVAAHPGDLSNVIVLEDQGLNSQYGAGIKTTDQARNLESLGSKPAALILGDTEPGALPSVAMVDDTVSLTTVSITKKDRDALVEAINASATGSIEITLTHADPRPATSTPVVYPTSSWGVSPDLTLKPEITAPGGNILSAGIGKSYDYMTGTSQATPHVAGVAALLRQRIASDPLFARMSPSDKDAVVTNILMGTAHPLPDAEQLDGTYYSPRRVGAGIVDAVAATTTAVYPTVEGALDPSRPKADLGDGTQGWTFKVTLTNLSSEEHSYRLGGQALSEIVEDKYFSEHSKNWAGQGISLTFSANTLRVPAKSSATVTVTVTPQAEFASYANSHASKGTFIDGAVTFTSIDGQPDLTVPYMGFYGSWGDPSVFVSPGDKDHQASSSLINLSTSAPLDMPRQGLKGARYVVSRSTLAGAPTKVAPRTILLRNVPTMTYTYKNHEGATVRSYIRERARKYPFEGKGQTQDLLRPEGFDSPVFDGLDANGKELPDGNYTLTIEAATDGPSPTVHKLEYEFALDTHAPVVTNLEVTGEGDNRTIIVDITDSSPLGGYGFSATTESEPFSPVTKGLTDEAQSDGTYSSHYEISWKDLPESLRASNPTALTFYAWDTGNNRTTAQVSFAGIPMTSLSLIPESSSLVVGQSMVMLTNYEPQNATITDVVWSSSNEAVATVDDQGHVRAVGAGSATITATDASQPSVSASAQVSVRAVSSWTGIELSAASITLAPGESVPIEAFLASTFRGRPVTWTLEPSWLGTVQPSSDTLRADVTASSREGTGTLRATVRTRYGRARTVSIPVEVKADHSRDFIIDSDGVLTSYEGATSDVVIPDTVTAIGSSAFSKAGSLIRSVHVPASVTQIRADAFASTSLSSVTFEDTRTRPSQLTSIGDRAFARTQLTSITLPGAVTTIGEGTFSGSASLTSIDVDPVNTAFESIDGVLFSKDHSLLIRFPMAKLYGGAYTVPEGTLEISSRAFDGSMITSVTVADSVTTIGKEAFADCPPLTSVHIGASVASFDPSMLANDGAVSTLTVSADNALLSAENNVLYVREPDGLRLVYFSPANAVTDYSVRAGTVAVGARAFANAAHLQRVVVPEGVTTIDDGAFDGTSSLTELVLPDSLQFVTNLVNTGLEAVEYGGQVRSIRSTGYANAYIPRVVVRGGVEGVYFSEARRGEGVQHASAYFGEGMRDISFKQDNPDILVVPSTLTQLTLGFMRVGGGTPDLDIYVAAAEGSEAWKVAQEAADYIYLEPGHMHTYTPAAVSLSGTGIAEAGAGYELMAPTGAPAQFTASVTGGVPGTYQVRGTQVGADGIESIVLDWADMTTAADRADAASATLTWTPPNASTTLRVEVRDVTHLRTPVTLAVKGGPSPEPTPEPTPDPTPTPTVGSWTWSGGCWKFAYLDGTSERSTTTSIDGSVYRFDASGCARTGWVNEGESWYYHSSTGAQQTGWLTLGRSSYYLDTATGVRATGWTKIGNSWYYFTPSTGQMATGWLKDGSSWYYLQPGSGTMATGWVRIGGKWYHFSANGKLL